MWLRIGRSSVLARSLLHTKPSLKILAHAQERRKMTVSKEPKAKEPNTKKETAKRPASKEKDADIAAPERTEPKKKRAKPSLPSEPVGARYDKSMRRSGPKPEEKLTIMSWNVAGALITDWQYSVPD
jgi:hypothetical protein